MSKSLKAVRDRLWKKNPHCRYCGVVTILPQHVIKGRDGLHRLRHFPDNMATIDHLRSRLDPERGNHIPSERRYILSCNKCNNKRGKKEVSELDLEKLWKQSKRFPIAMSPSQIDFFRDTYCAEG